MSLFGFGVRRKERGNDNIDRKAETKEKLKKIYSNWFNHAIYNEHYSNKLPNGKWLNVIVTSKPPFSYLQQTLGLDSTYGLKITGCHTNEKRTEFVLRLSNTGELSVSIANIINEYGDKDPGIYPRILLETLYKSRWGEYISTVEGEVEPGSEYLARFMRGNGSQDTVAMMQSTIMPFEKGLTFIARSNGYARVEIATFNGTRGAYLIDSNGTVTTDKRIEPEDMADGFVYRIS